MKFEPLLTTMSLMVAATSVALGILFLAGEISRFNVPYPKDCLGCGSQDDNNIPIFILMILCGLLLIIHVYLRSVNKNKFGDQD